MNLTEEQYEELKQVLEARHDYSIMVKEHNSAKSELMSNFLEKICPKPSGKMSPLDKERFKEERKKASSFLKDTERLYLRDVNNEEDTTPEALMASEKLIG